MNRGLKKIETIDNLSVRQTLKEKKTLGILETLLLTLVS